MHLDTPSLNSPLYSSIPDAARIVDFGQDLPVDYRRLRPSPPLQDIVEGIWIQQEYVDPDCGVSGCVVPTGTVEILFQYGEPIGHREPGGIRKMPGSYVTGQRSRPVETVPGGCFGIVLVSLYPWGLNQLFPGSVEAPDGFVDLKLLGGAGRVAQLEESLWLARSTEERVWLIEAFLLETRRPGIDRRMATACRLLSDGRIEKPLQHTAQTLGISERHLSRTFKSTVGLQPNVFMRIMRFQKAIRLRRKSGLSWAAVAASCGYSDQAHLVHEVKKFSGRSPAMIMPDGNPVDSIFNGKGISRFFDTVYLQGPG